MPHTYQVGKADKIIVTVRIIEPFGGYGLDREFLV
jgi:hypothetical protein